LLHAALRGDSVRTEAKQSWFSVTPFGPPRQAREGASALRKESLLVYAIECIGEIDFGEDGVVGVPISVTPLLGGFEAHFSAKRLGNPDLKREQVRSSIILHGRA